MAYVLGFIRSLAGAVGVARAVVGVLKGVFGAAYGVTHSGAWALAAEDVAHLFVTFLSIFGSALSFTAVVAGDLSHGLAWAAAGIAATVATLHKWASAAKTPAKS